MLICYIVPYFFVIEINEKYPARWFSMNFTAIADGFDCFYLVVTEFEAKLGFQRYQHLHDVERVGVKGRL